MDRNARISFQVYGAVTALVVVGSTLLLTGSLDDLSEEWASVLLTFLWIFLPFAVLPSVAVVSTRVLPTLVVVTLIFWAVVLLMTSGSSNDANFGVAFAIFLSPAVIGLTALLGDRVLRSRVTKRLFGDQRDR